MAKMTSGQQGLLKLPDDSVIKDPFYKTTGNYTSSDLDSLNSLVDTGGNLVKLDEGMINSLSKYYGKVSGLEEYVTGLVGKGSVFGKDQDYVSASKIKKLAAKSFNSGVDPTTVQGYSTDLAATNEQIRSDQVQRKEQYYEWQKALKLPADQYQLWLEKKQAEMDKVSANETVNAVQDTYFEDLPTGVTTPITSKTALSSSGSSIGTFTSMYNDALKTANISDLQAQLGDLNMQIANQQNIYQQRLNAVGGQTVSLDVIGGKQSEIARQEQANLNFLANQKAALVDQINTSMQMVETYMKYQQIDYQAAQDAYEMQYKQQMDMLNYAQEERSYKQKTALANLTILQNQISKGELDVTKLSGDEKLQINKLELQSGLPIGTTQKMIGQVKGDEILFHEIRDEADGNSYLYTTRKATDGIIRTIKEYLGPQEPKAAKSGGGGGGGSSSKLSGLPSGNTMTTTRFNSMMGEIAKMDNSDYAKWQSNYDYLSKKYYEASDSDVREYLGQAPAGGFSAEDPSIIQERNEEKAVSAITDWITDYFTF